MKGDEWMAQAQGTMDTIVLAIAELIARHPDKSGILWMLGATISSIPKAQEPPTLEDHRNAGKVRAIGLVVAHAQVREAVQEIREDPSAPQH